jgi:glycosyltransferase involved in cell wall biosynthesis
MAGLAIYTNSYPYGNAETFLESETACLSHHFEKIYIIPFSGNGEMRFVPGNVRVLSPIQDKKWSILKMYLTGLSHFYIIHQIPELKKGLSGFSFLKSFKYLGYALLTKRRLLGIFPDKSLIHYSYWLNFSAFALTLLKKEGRIKTVISRAHGFDLYEERGEKSLAFIKGATLKNLDKIFLISNHGRNYLLNKFPDFSDKYFLSRLGTSDPEFTNPSPGNSGLTLVSCSAINPNKRINLILESLILFSTRFPSVNVSWYHLGSGSDIIKYVEKADKALQNSSVRCFLPGQLTHPEIIKFYKSIPVDLFLTVSESEGIPVTIMEAQSFGIPAIATAVGGVPEIVNDANGFLLSVNPTPDEITRAIYDVFINKVKWEKKRKLSRKNWEENFNAEENYNAFAIELLSLV